MIQHSTPREGMPGKAKECQGKIPCGGSWFSCDRLSTQKGRSLGPRVAGALHGWALVSFFLFFPLILSAVAAPPRKSPVPAQVPPEISRTFDEADAMGEGGKIAEAVTLVDSLLENASNPAALRPLAADFFSRRAKALAASRKPSEIPADQADTLTMLLRKAREQDPGNGVRWRENLEFLAARPGCEAAFANEGQEFLNSGARNLPKDQLSAWEAVFGKLNNLYQTQDLPILRREVLEYLARSPGTATQAARDLSIVTETVRGRMKETLEKVEISLTIGETGEAEAAIRQIERFDPSIPALRALKKKLETVRKIQELLVQVQAAVTLNQASRVRSLCKDVLDLDPNNHSAKAYLAQLEASGTQSVGGRRESDPLKHRKIQLLADLKTAEADEDLLAVRRLLRELIQVGGAVEMHFKQLSDVEKDLFEGRLRISERFDEAKELLSREKWEELRKLINRNPAMASSMERMTSVWEMALAANLRLARKDEEQLLADADRIESKKPNSFWATITRMEIALRNRKWEEGEKLYLKAESIIPKHPALKASYWLIWTQTRGKKILPFLILFIIWLMVKQMHFVLDWWERFYWTRVQWVAGVFPGLALSSLETKFGKVNDEREKTLMFELLTKCAFRKGDKVKGVRYAEVLLEVKPGHPLATDYLGATYSALPTLTQEHFPIVMAYCQQHPENKGVLEKVGKFILANNAVSPETIPILNRYSIAFPADTGALLLMVEYFKTFDPSELPANGLETLEKAYQANRTTDLLYPLVKIHALRGNFEKARTILQDAYPDPSTGEGASLVGALDADVSLALQKLLMELSGIDRAIMLASLQKVLRNKYLGPDHVTGLVTILDHVSRDDDPSTRSLAQKAIEHVRQVGPKTEEFRSAFLFETDSLLPPAPSFAPEGPPPAPPPPDAPPQEESNLQEGQAPAVDEFPPLVSGDGSSTAGPVSDPLAFASDESPTPPLRQTQEPSQIPAADPAADPAVQTRAAAQPGAAASLDQGELSGSEAESSLPLSLEAVAFPAPLPPEPVSESVSSVPLSEGLPSQVLPFPLLDSSDTGATGTPGSGRGDFDDTPVLTLDLSGESPRGEPGEEAALTSFHEPPPSSAPGSPATPAIAQDPAALPSIPLPQEPPLQPPIEEQPSVPVGITPSASGLPSNEAAGVGDLPPETSPYSEKAAPAEPLEVSPPPPTEADVLFNELGGIDRLPTEPPPIGPPAPEAVERANSLFSDLPAPESIDDRILTLSPTAPVQDIIPLLETSGKAQIPAWVSFLASEPALETLSSILCKFGKFRSPDMTPLIARHFRSSDPVIRKQVILALQENRDKRGLAIILTMMRDPIASVRDAGIAAVSTFPVEEIMEQVNLMTKAEEAPVRAAAAFVLGGIHGTTSTEILEKFLSDPELEVRKSAVESLARQGASENYQILSQHFEFTEDEKEREMINNAMEFLKKLILARKK